MDTAVLAALSGLLGLEGFEVVEITSDRIKKTHVVAMVSTMMAAPCGGCGATSSDRHACHERRVADLPCYGWQTELVITLFQFKCTACGKFFTPQYPSVLANGPHATERLLERLAELATFSDISSASRFLGIAEKTAEDWYYDYLRRKQKQPAKDLKPIRSMGIDELSLKKDTGNSPAF